MHTIQSFHKTRIAPTPSGYLHLGNLYAFALAAALARQHQAGILLRIDDMDRERTNPLYIEDIFETLEFMGIPWTEGPRNAEEFNAHYSQRHRLPLYQRALEMLRTNGLVYACDCSRSQIHQQSHHAYPGTCRHKQIPLDAPEVAWRLRTTSGASIRIKTLKGLESSMLPVDMHDVVVRKKDGCPAYQLSSVVDDLHYGIDLVVRGSDLRPSSLVQLHLAGLLHEQAFAGITFHHHALIRDASARKLSKSAGDTSIHYLRGQGHSAEAIYNLLGKRLGLRQPLMHWEGFMSE